jgi:hypothetical protein
VGDAQPVWLGDRGGSGGCSGAVCVHVVAIAGLEQEENGAVCIAIVVGL